MNTDIHIDPVINDLSHAAKDAVHCATDKAKEIYHTAARKAEEAVTTSREYVRRNPAPVILGAIALGAAIGYLIVKAQRKPTFAERFADEPLDSVRDAIFSALAPVTQRVHDGYDSARGGISHAIDRVQHFGNGHCSHSMSNRIGRAVSNLKFW